jgi:hypothetical protein
VIVLSSGWRFRRSDLNETDVYAKPGLTVSIEFFPPKTRRATPICFARSRVLKTLKAAFRGPKT